MKKAAFTLVESLVSLLIISAVSMAVLVFTSAYLKTDFDRDMQIKAVMSNLSTVEKLRAEVKTIPQLYEFSKDKDIEITSVGEGKIEFSEDGSYFVKEPETDRVLSSLLSDDTKILKIEVGGTEPNTKITTVVILR